MKNRRLLMIPGPTEFTPEVLSAMGLPTTSHVAANFIDVFGEAIERLRSVFLSPSGQPFVVAGSGTLAMEMAAANLIEPGDRILVVGTGYFSDRFAAICRRQGATVTVVGAAVPGDAPSLEEVDRHLSASSYSLMTVTHVDTSTGVRADVRGLASLGRKQGVLVVVDGVCSVGGEEFRQDEWGVDCALTASQKAIGVPPGLALLVAGPRALERFRTRSAPVGSVYCDWNEWLPIMEAYESRRPSYFGTPPVNLIWALNVSLGQILAEGMDARVLRHTALSSAFRSAMSALRIQPVPRRDDLTASTLTACYYPEGIDAGFVSRVADRGVLIAGGLHPEIRSRYFRVGHMGAVTESDILSTVGAIEGALIETGTIAQPGEGLRAVISARSVNGPPHTPSPR